MMGTCKERGRDKVWFEELFLITSDLSCSPSPVPRKSVQRALAAIYGVP